MNSPWVCVSLGNRDICLYVYIPVWECVHTHSCRYIWTRIHASYISIFLLNNLAISIFYLSIYLSSYLSINLSSTYLSIYLSSAHFSFYLSVYLSSTYLSIYLSSTDLSLYSPYLSIPLFSTCLSIILNMYPCVLVHLYVHSSPSWIGLIAGSSFPRLCLSFISANA